MMEEKSRLQRWKEGIAMITPLQSAQASQKANWVMLIGFLGGIITMAFNLKQWWWIEIILTAGLFNHSIMMIGIQQKINMLSKFEQEDKNGNGL
jgi:predicted CDP-diglyceride synthetase/phosphatidate cytidylyltransferase